MRTEETRPLSHDEVVHTVATWLRKQPWCDMSCPELAGAYYRGAGPAYPGYRSSPEEWAAYESAKEAHKLTGGGVCDVIGFTVPDYRKRYSRPRVAIVEVKVSRADLVGDLRRGKMLRYESQATECALAVTPAVLGDRSTEEAVAEWRSLGLPAEWGVLLVQRGPRGAPWVHMIHRWKALGPRGLTPTEEQLRRLTARAAVSLSWRHSALVLDLYRRGGAPPA